MAQSTWQNIRVSRTVVGVWTMYRDGNLLSTAGGAGTNPFTDAAHLSGNYIVVNLGVGDKLALGAIDGSNALVKRIKSVI